MYFPFLPPCLLLSVSPFLSYHTDKPSLCPPAEPMQCTAIACWPWCSPQPSAGFNILSLQYTLLLAWLQSFTTNSHLVYLSKNAGCCTTSPQRHPSQDTCCQETLVIRTGPLSNNIIPRHLLPQPQPVHLPSTPTSILFSSRARKIPFYSGM